MTVKRQLKVLEDRTLAVELWAMVLALSDAGKAALGVRGLFTVVGLTVVGWLLRKRAPAEARAAPAPGAPAAAAALAPL